ncbi:MAG TPA: hypothetical protein PK777_08315, partial [Thermoguttaceae bacterium]|nr:hypothetical protein [Thermoguttaceae bacterium]
EALGIKPAHSEVKQRLRDSKQSLADRHLKNVDALCHTGKFSEAQQELQEVFKILSDHPKATELQTKLATVSQLTQEAQQAERQAEQAEKEEEKIKSYQTAFAFWKQAQEILPDNPFLIAAKEKARQKAGIPPEPEGPKKPEEKPEPPPPIVDQRTLEDKLREHKMVISTSTQVEAAVRNKQTRIIELADTCTYSQFDAQQANLLRDWVRNGGILWVNNDVLNGIFGITYSRITNPLFWGAVTTPAGGSSPILKGVKKVYLTDLEDKSFNLAFPKSIPLLATEDVLGFSGGNLRPGDTLWSLVPYGKGWISDPKPIRFDKGEGSVFWTNFVLFCLGELKIEIEIDDSKRGGGDHPPLTLTGMWQATTGEEFFFEDDGKEVKIKLARPTPGFASMIGTIKRTDSAADPQKLTGLKLEGKLTVTFQGFPKPQTATVRVILDDENTMRWILPDWPIVIRTNIYRTAEKIILTRGGAFPGKR